MSAEGTPGQMESAAAPGADNAIQVCVRVRPLNDRERDEGHRTIVSFDEPTKQVVLTAVDKDTLLQLRGATAKGYAFDRRYGQDDTASTIYDEVVGPLVENCFKGYNATVLAYGQTGSGKTHTMAGGIGIHGKFEEGVTPRVIRHVFAIADSLSKRAKPGERTEVSAYALELYNEELLDLSIKSGRDETGKGWDGAKGVSAGLKLTERPVGKDGRVVPEVVGVKEVRVRSAEELKKFFDDCMENRSTSSTKLNDRSSRSHAIITITIHRTVVEVLNELGDDFKAKVRTVEFNSKLHLVDLAGSERVKRSGVTGKELKEATHINSGLLALGNVITALSNEGEGKKKGHIPYRDSKLTRLLQDSLGGNSLTALISCISPSEADFEETNNTLKYANRACHIKNTPLPNKYTMLEEDLLPTIPMGMASSTGLGLFQLQALLEDHERLKENRERKAREKAEKEAKRMAALQAMKEETLKKPGFQRLRANQYDELRRQLASRGATNIPQGQVIGDDTLRGFGRMRLTQSVDGPLPHSPATATGAASVRKSMVARHRVHAKDGSSESSPHTTPRRGMVSQSVRLGAKPTGQSFADWLESQQAAGSTGGSVDGSETAYAADDFFEQGEMDGSGSDFIIQEDDDNVIMEDDSVIVEDDEAAGAGAAAGAAGSNSIFADEGDEAMAPSTSAALAGIVEEAEDATAVPTVTKSKFRRAGKKRESATEQLDVHNQPPSTATPVVLEDTTTITQAGALEDTAAMGANDSVLFEGDDVEEVILEEPEHEHEAEQEAEPEQEAEEDMYDPIQDENTPKLLARFKVNMSDTLSVFKACTKEDFQDVISLLPENTPLPASDKMTYLLARLEVHGSRHNMESALARVGTGECTMNDAVGPAVGCLMATFGTNMIASCIFEFEDPEDLRFYGVEERIELWGLQIPHNSVRPSLQTTTAADGEAEADSKTAAAAADNKAAAAAGDKDKEKDKEDTSNKGVITWSSVDRLNMSIGLLYALCNYAREMGIRCGFCVPRPQLLRRWLQAGVRMKQITTPLKLIYPPSAHDYEYYKASTVAFFMVSEVRDALEKVLGIVAVQPNA